MKAFRIPVLGGVAIAALLFVSQPQPTFGASYVVDTTLDTSLTACTGAAGDCSLRGAITTANGTGAGDVITFDATISGMTITLGGVLPSMSGGGDTIDGTGSGVIIDALGDPAAFSCFVVASTGNTLKGLELTDCQNGILLNNVNSKSNVIGPGNVIYDNTSGIVILNSGAMGNTVAGNKIGTTADGSATHPDGGNATGVLINAGSNNTIGGLTSADRNVISGNTNGIILVGANTTLNVVTGNYVGASASGLTDVGNTNGVQLTGSATNNTVGGATAAAANLISGNSIANVFITGGVSNTIRGNIIGPDITGSGATMANGDGVFISASSPNNTIGPGNVISDNVAGGHFSGASSPGNVVKGNFIGTDLTGTTGVPNTGAGVFFESSASGNTIGGTNPGDGNVITFNGAQGVLVSGAMVTANAIRGNSIHDNTGLEIDLTAGGNTELAVPTILYATANGVGGTACATCVVEIFSDDASDAEFYEGSTLADGSGEYLLLANIAGPNVTATNTNAGGNTSELSAVKAGLDPDTDGDGVANAFDNCPTTPNSDQGDADGDGDGNACDNCPSTPNANQDDSDGDAVGDLCDNCYSTDNGPAEAVILGVGNQSDADGDGVPGTQPPPGASFGGDACDVDDDNDGLPDTMDSCRTLAEDYDGWQDEGGCPDTDNDGDGICDPGLASVSCAGSDFGRYLWKSPLPAQQDCRNVAEDFDSFHDSDGCPEPDNDYDNFPDGTDDCPATDTTAGPDGIADTGDEPVLYLTPYQSREDFDGVIDNDGCHDSPGDDYDRDGFTDEAEALHIGTSPTNQCGTGGWPADFVGGEFSTDLVTIQDLGSFLAPDFHFNTFPQDAGFDARWDLIPGPAVPNGEWINIQDMAALLTGPTSTPPMLNGASIFNGPSCPLPP